MYLDILKNPIFLAVLAGAITYLYLWWDNKKKKGKAKKNVNIIIPIVVAVVVCIIAYFGFNYWSTPSTNNLTPDQIAIKTMTDPKISMSPKQTFHLTKDLSSSEPASFHLITRGINIPNKLNVPDVFIETY